MRASLVIAILGLTMGLATAAPPPPKDPRETAKALVAEGHAAWDRGEWATALERYQAAYAAFPAPNLHYDLGLAFEKLGHQVEALASFEAFLTEAPGAPADARTHAQERVAELDKLVPTLEVMTDPEGVSVVIDNKPVGKTPLPPLRIAAGPHEVKVDKRGLTPQTRRVTLDPGVRFKLPIAMSALELRVLPSPSPSPSPSASPLLVDKPTQPPKRKRSILGRWWFWGGVGAVAATAVVIVVATSSSSGADLPDSDLGVVRPFGN